MYVLLLRDVVHEARTWDALYQVKHMQISCDLKRNPRWHVSMLQIWAVDKHIIVCTRLENLSVAEVNCACTKCKHNIYFRVQM